MHDTPLLLLELGAVVLGLAVLARVASRLGVSSAPLYLVAGIAFGEGGVLPLVTARRFIDVGAELGVILLLLMLGLEFSGDELVRAMRGSVAPGVLDFAANFTPGFVAGLLLGWRPVAAMALGGVTYISSSGIAAKLVDDFGWTANTETPSVLSLLVFEDLVMVLYLPLLAALVVGGGFGLGSAVPAALAITLTLGTLLVAVRLSPALSRLVFIRSDEALLLTILGVALVVAGVAETVQASAAVAAFLVGVGISGPAAAGARTTLPPVRDLFAAVFFFFFGLEIDALRVLPVGGYAVGLAVVTAATKAAVGWWGAGRAGAGRAARRRAASVLVARGEFSIVIAGIATASGIESDLGPLAAAYVVVLAVAGPVAARLADRPVRRRRAAVVP